MTHRQAHQQVEEQGGQATTHLSRQTTLLVVGEEGWPLEADGKTSVKLQQAVELINQGLPLRIIQESDWLRLLGLEQRERESRRLHTPAMLQQLLGMPVSLVRRWEKLGLIRAVQRVYRLPYFDFQEVAGVRKLHELLTAGVSRSQIEASLEDLKNLLPSLERPMAQLEILERDSQVLVRDACGLLDPRSGQRLFDFDGGESVAGGELLTIGLPTNDAGSSEQKTWGADDWFDQGCRLLEQHDATGAIEAFRLALMDEPCKPELHFHLADALFRSNNLQGALERLHCAVEHDHDDIEAWTQLGCVRQLLGDMRGAIDAFDIALKAHPAYADAMYHKAALLAELGRQDEAAVLWTQYLEHDRRGPWADAARQFLGMPEDE